MKDADQRATATPDSDADSLTTSSSKGCGKNSRGRFIDTCTEKDTGEFSNLAASLVEFLASQEIGRQAKRTQSCITINHAHNFHVNKEPNKHISADQVEAEIVNRTSHSRSRSQPKRGSLAISQFITRVMLVLQPKQGQNDDETTKDCLSSLLTTSAILPSKTFSQHHITLPLRIRGGGAVVATGAPTHPLRVVSVTDPLTTMKQFTTGKDPACVRERFFQCLCEQQRLFSCPSTFSPKASYIPYRRFLVDWMSAVGEKIGLLTCTIHTAVMYLDKILRTRDEIPESRYKLLATACISIAKKYEEIDGAHLPFITQLLQVTKIGHTLRTFREEGEVKVLQYLGYRLSTVPPLLVVEYFFASDLAISTDTVLEYDSIPNQVKKWNDFFCGLALQEYSFQQYRPTELAAAILLATRVAVGLTPPWKPDFVRLTGGMELYQVTPIFLHVWSYFGERFPEYANETLRA